MSDSVDRVFVHALNTVKRIPRTGSARPPETDRLKLYGLYKQSTEGDVAGLLPRPVLPTSTRSTDYKAALAEREKYDAWNSHQGMGRTEAKRQYIATLIETMHRYATTTAEARELVAELEFVWDQIKSQGGSASDSSSPGAAGRPRNERKRTMTSERGGDDNGDDDDGVGMISGLRMLRPMSEEDEDEEGEANDQDGDGEGREYYEVATGQESSKRPDPNTSPQREQDIRHRKWRRRMEQALMKLGAEIAAMREQLEARQIVGTTGARTGWAWTKWLLMLLLRHVFFDAAILGVLFVWARRKGDRRLERALQLFYSWIRTQAMGIGIPAILQPQPARVV